MLTWTLAGLHLAQPVWADRLLAVGERQDDCDYAVDLFDGATGQQRPLFRSASPRGYRLLQVSGRKVVVEEVLDNCASQRLRRVFSPTCRSLDLDRPRPEDVPCPAAR
jgi:hypothetical protein